MLRRKLLELGVTVALGVNYAGAFVVAVLWSWPDPESELYVFVLAFLVITCLFGAIIVDMRKALLYAAISAAIGIFLASAILSAPSILTEENLALVDVSITVALGGVSRLFIVGAAFLVMGAIVGCFIGDAISE